MLTAVHLNDDHDGTVMVQFYGDAESDTRSFWIQGRAMLEQVARICLDTRVDQMVDDRLKEMITTEKTKKAA